MTFPLVGCSTWDARDNAPVPRQQRGVVRQHFCPPKTPSQEERVQLREAGNEPCASDLSRKGTFF